MLKPSKVLVPRPISSRMTRLRLVAWLRMFAVSFISTMKVLWPRPRSSLAPTRVKMRSSSPTTARLAGNEAAAMGQKREHGDLPDVGAFARHVRTGENDEALGRPRRAARRSARIFRWREAAREPDAAPLRKEGVRPLSFISGLEVIAFLRERAPAEQHIEFMDRPRGILDGTQMRCRGRAQVEEELVLELPRAFLRAEDFRFHLLQFRRHEALGVGHGLLARVVGGDGGLRFEVLISM